MLIQRSPLCSTVSTFGSTGACAAGASMPTRAALRSLGRGMLGIARTEGVVLRSWHKSILRARACVPCPRAALCFPPGECERVPRGPGLLRSDAGRHRYGVLAGAAALGG